MKTFHRSTAPGRQGAFILFSEALEDLRRFLRTVRDAGNCGGHPSACAHCQAAVLLDELEPLVPEPQVSETAQEYRRYRDWIRR